MTHNDEALIDAIFGSTEGLEAEGRTGIMTVDETLNATPEMWYNISQRIGTEKALAGAAAAELIKRIQNQNGARRVETR